jgi:hypothetical protein
VSCSVASSDGLLGRAGQTGLAGVGAKDPAPAASISRTALLSSEIVLTAGTGAVALEPQSRANKRVNLIRSRSGGGYPSQTAHRLRAVRWVDRGA